LLFIYLFIVDGVFECGIQQIRQWMGVARLRCARQTENHYNPKSGNALQHTATHCNTLQHTATHKISDIGERWVWLACDAQGKLKITTTPNQVTRGNTLQHTATHCNTLQHTKFLILERDGCGAYAMREAN